MIEQHKRGELLIVKRRGHNVPTPNWSSASTHERGGKEVMLPRNEIVVFLRRNKLYLQVLTPRGVVWIFGSYICKLPID